MNNKYIYFREVYDNKYHYTKSTYTYYSIGKDGFISKLFFHGKNDGDFFMKKHNRYIGNNFFGIIIEIRRNYD